MVPISTRERLHAAAMLGLGELRGAYNERKRAIALKAKQKRQQAKTRIEAARIKALEAKEMSDLEREMYEAKLAAIRAKAAAKRVRQAAGVYTPGERLGRIARGAAVVTGSFYKGLTTSDSKKRRKKR